MSIKITGLKEIERNIKRKQKELEQAAKKAIRKSLNEAAKELEKTAKPLVPTLGRSTDFRQKGSVKNNIRHRTKVRKNGLSGYTVVRVRRTKGRRMARIGENTRDRTDPFYWFLLDQGTSKMEGKHFMEKTKKQGGDKALKKAEKILVDELKKQFK
ncbi:HK97-gp10 family putative phage morphogenesis protein [Otariodibacter oris]|uniref:HK97 gp10 family phage protein n=1 Tax=Otariodibacter oris TaxID=1032623 RepID=A0A420XIR6_9PAST|nr:HK97-gp10 family putative phage morphogenesis protein [Otariodibacter oris]QGM80712.1 hypothetical protein A6A10_04480 [Otariodibacter oris]RKR77126.1 HK97 gp10 family phage protein [Otariodibacter oris]